MASAAIVPPSGTDIWRTPSAQPRRAGGYARKSAPVPAIGTAAEPTPDTTSATTSTAVDPAVAATPSPATPRAVPTSIGPRVPKRSTAIPAAINVSPEPNNPAVSTAPSSARLSWKLRLSSGPIAGRPMAHERHGGLGAGSRCEHDAGRAGSGALHVFHYLVAVDVDEIVRARRRQQALDALDFEHGREAAVLAQIDEVLTELEGSRIDEAAFARMAPEDVTLVREVLDPGGDEPEDEFDLEARCRRSRRRRSVASARPSVSASRR